MSRKIKTIQQIREPLSRLNGGLMVTLLLALYPAAAEQWANEAIPFQENAGCLAEPMAQFGGYIGNWHIEDSQLQDDGVTWNQGAGRHHGVAGRPAALCASGRAVAQQ